MRLVDATYNGGDDATIWYHWNGINYTVGTDSATTTTSDTSWYYWNADFTGTAVTYSAEAVWTSWNASTEYTYIPVQPQPEQQQRLREEQEARAKATAEANERAKELLIANLSEAQRKEFENVQSFTVVSKDGQRKYRIRKGWSHNVEVFDNKDARLHSLCAHPCINVPEYDNMLAQKLMLEHAEDEFLAIANRR